MESLAASHGISSQGKPTPVSEPKRCHPSGRVLTRQCPGPTYEAFRSAATFTRTPQMKEGPFILGITSKEPSLGEHQQTRRDTRLRPTFLVPETKPLLPSIKQATMGTHSDPTHQWKLYSVQEALLLFIFAATAIVGLCASATLRKKRTHTEKTVEQGEGVVEATDNNESIGKPADEQPVSGWAVIKKALTSSSHWNEGTKQVGSENGWKSQEETGMMDDQGGPEGCENTPGLPIWQRRILMGERCQLPRFSGLILYDDHGRPIHDSSDKDAPDQAKQKPVGTALKDLL